MAALRRFFNKLVRRKFPFKFIYSDKYWMTGMNSHVFPIAKYRLLYYELLRMGARKENFLEPSLISDEDLLLVHTEKYLNKLKSLNLSHTELMTLEMPFSQEIKDFFWRTAGGTLLAAETALCDGTAVHIGGGFHHAFPNHGEGFCILNDIAVAVEKLKKEDRLGRAMIVDCDVHQGNGTAYIFSKKDYVFTYSIHQMDVYPSHKQESDMDVGLWSGDGDEGYLSSLNLHFPRLFEEFQPDLVIYVAGADPYENDKLGGLKLTLAGLAERDRIILKNAYRLGIPTVVVFGGGYALHLEDTVAIHINTILSARDFFRSFVNNYS
ncbi:MAG: histone deacetylase [Candidatus Aminicenantes bacterium]|nr:histone deacetylase [Candidatus Aminicenantes bacterium]